MVIFHSFLYVYQRVYGFIQPLFLDFRSGTDDTVWSPCNVINCTATAVVQAREQELLSGHLHGPCHGYYWVPSIEQITIYSWDWLEHVHRKLPYLMVKTMVSGWDFPLNQSNKYMTIMFHHFSIPFIELNGYKWAIYTIANWQIMSNDHRVDIWTHPLWTMGRVTWARRCTSPGTPNQMAIEIREPNGNALNWENHP